MRPSLVVLAVMALLPFALGACATGGGPHKEAIDPSGGEITTPFSPIVRSGDLLFLSGVIGRSQDGDIGQATRQSLEGIANRLEATDAGMQDVVKCTVFLVDMDDYQGMNEVYAEFFPPPAPPARSAIAVRDLPASAQVEIECIAALP